MLPRREEVETGGVASSCQFDCLVASLEVARMVEREGVDVGCGGGEVERGTVLVEVAVMVAFLRRFLMRWPSPSEDDSSVEDVVWGGGVAGRLRVEELLFLDVRFLKSTAEAFDVAIEVSIMKFTARGRWN